MLVTWTELTVVLALPMAMLGGLGGELLEALLVAGAFAAFLSTSSGLLVSISGVLSQDVLKGSVRDFRRSALVAGAVPLLLALPASDLPVGVTVGLAFAFAASTFCPLLVLGIWWRRLTAVGAAAGLIVGGGLAASAILATFLGVGAGGWTGALLGQPAIWTVPTTFIVMIAVSLMTPSRVPVDVGRTMLALHAQSPWVSSGHSAGLDGHKAPDRSSRGIDRSSQASKPLGAWAVRAGATPSQASSRPPAGLSTVTAVTTKPETTEDTGEHRRAGITPAGSGAGHASARSRRVPLGRGPGHR